VQPRSLPVPNCERTRSSAPKFSNFTFRDASHHQPSLLFLPQFNPSVWRCEKMGNQGSNLAARPSEFESSTWNPDKTTWLPSPWHNFDFHASACRDRDKANTFPLSHLPAEIVYHIAKSWLSPASIAALAMTCKAMFDLVGPQLRRMDDLSKHERWNLITLLERDCDLATACPACLKLHLPFPAELGMSSCDATPDLYLPIPLTPMFCRYILRRHNSGQPYAELVSGLLKTKSLVLEDHKQFLSHTLRVAENGNLLVRREIVLHPTSTTDKGRATISSRSAYLLQRALCSRLARDLVCCHVGPWVNTIPFNSAAKFVPPEWDCCRDNRFASTHDERYHYPIGSAYHRKECFSNKPLSTRKLAAALGDVMECALLHPQPCQRREKKRKRLRGIQGTTDDNNNTVGNVGCTLRMNRELGLVLGCNDCCTDYCVNIRDMEGIGRVVVLTTWKDLGGPTPQGRVKWFSHRSDLNYIPSLQLFHFKKVTGWRPSMAGSICCQFEGLPPQPVVVGPPCYRYEPKPSPVLARKFTQVPPTEKPWFHANLSGLYYN